MNDFQNEGYWRDVAVTFYNLYKSPSDPDISNFIYEYEGKEKKLERQQEIDQDEFAYLIDQITDYLDGE